jgi:hypothetical protein
MHRNAGYHWNSRTKKKIGYRVAASRVGAEGVAAVLMQSSRRGAADGCKQARRLHALVRVGSAYSLLN